MEVEVESGGEIQAEGVAFDKEVRHSINASALTEHVTEMEQAMRRAARPSSPSPLARTVRRVFAQRTAAFNRQIDEECEFPCAWRTATPDRMAQCPAKNPSNAGNVNRPFNGPYNALLLS